MRTTDREIQELRDQILGQVDLSKEPDDREISNLVAETCSHFAKGKLLNLAEQEELRQYLFHSLRKLDVLQELLDDPEITDRFQLVINGSEIINAYSELVDPNEQRRRLQVQAQSHANGDEEAMVMDDDYLTAMEYGMPPISGWGMGIDRVLQVLLGTENIRDTVMFPLMRPEP